jgi:hypothetical protein
MVRDNGTPNLESKNNLSHESRRSASALLRMNASNLRGFLAQYPKATTAGISSPGRGETLCEKLLLVKVPPSQHVLKPMSVANKMMLSIR